MEILHFETQEERLAYIKDGYKEIIPEKAKKKGKKKKDEVQAK